MLDTTEIKHYFTTLPSDDFLNNWTYLSRKRLPTWVLNFEEEETKPNLTMMRTPNGIHHLSARVSLPKMLFGHNARLLNQDEVNLGLDLKSKFVEENSGLPFDVETATVSLIHYAYDVHLTEPGVWRMVEKLSRKKMKPFLKDFYEDSTLYFKSKGKSKQIRIYPKLKEVLDSKKATEEAISEARGKLRFEYALLKKSAIDSLVERLGLPDSSPQSLLNEKVSDFVISELLEKLNFFDLLEPDKTRLQALRDCFPANKAMSLCGFMQMVEEHGEHFYKDKTLGFSKSSYCRSVRDCQLAKVW